jgi:hypothetical protein
VIYYQKLEIALIRYHHYLDEIDLDPASPVIIEMTVSGECEFAQCGIAPDDVRNMDSILTLVRSVALAGDGEAWRAVTERREVLCDYSVYDVARELSGRSVITTHPHDQTCLAVAQSLMGLPAS